MSPRELLERVVESAHQRATGQGVLLLGAVAPEMPDLVEGDPERLEQLFTALVDDLLRAGGPGEVVVTARPEGAVYRVDVSATGPNPTDAPGPVLGEVLGLLGGSLAPLTGPDRGHTIRLPLCPVPAPPGPVSPPTPAVRVAVTAPTPRSRQALCWLAGATGAAAVPLPAGETTGDGFDVVVRYDPPPGRPSVQVDFPGRPGTTRTVTGAVTRDRLARVVLSDRAAGSPPDRGRETGPSPRLVPLPPGRVLLAEDDEVNRTVLQRMINMLGVDCDVVRDGAAAVEALLGTDPYDLVLMDMHMPGVDGPEATSRVRAAGYRNPILALTATALEEDRELCLAAGMDGHVGKPITLPELRRALEPYLTAPSREPAPEDDNPAGDAQGQPDPGDVLSLRQLHDLEEQLEGRDLVAMTVGTFLAELDGRRQNMANALSAGDNHRLGAVAHTLKSSSALLGAQPLAEACARVERMAAASAAPGVLEAAVSEVDRTAAATAIAMAGYLSG